MTSPPRDINVVCPQCGNQYQDWSRSVNLDMDDFDSDYLDQCSSAVCPQCKYKVYFSTLIVKDGIFYFGDDKPKRARNKSSKSLSIMDPATSKQRQKLFDQKLRKLIKAVANEVNKEEDIRPFLCEGLPLECPIMLVGINPSKSAPFLDHWSAVNGCDKQGWMKKYLAINGRCSPTRHRIERLVKAIAPVRCLETNIFTHLSLTEKGVLDRDTRVFDFLLKMVRPGVMFVHGKSGVEHLRKLTNSTIPFQKLNKLNCPLDQYDKVKFDGFTFDVIAGPHLAYGWSYDRVEALGKSLADRYKLAEAAA